MTETIEARYLRAQFEAVPLPIPEDDSAPTRIHVLPWGTSDLRDKRQREQWGMPGTYEVGEKSADEIPKNFDRRDIDHSVNEKHDIGGRALGWLSGVEVVEDEGIFVEIDWTDEGRSLVENKAYRYASGEWVLDITEWMENDGPAHPVAVTGVGLTNKPAVRGFQPIMTASLTEALAGDDPAEDSKPAPDDGGKGESRMDGKTILGFFARLTGREPEDAIEAAEITAEHLAAKAEAEKAVEELEAATARVNTLTEELGEVQGELSAMKEAEEDRKTKERDAMIEAALASGKIAPPMVDWAKENFDSFLTLTEAVEDGAVGPPKGRQVTDEAISSADSGKLSGDIDAKTAEIHALAEEKGISYGDAFELYHKDDETRKEG